MKAPLLLDDTTQQTHTERFTSWKECFSPDAIGLFRPVKNLVFYILGDASIFYWHALNLLVYLIAVVAVYFLARHLFRSAVWALIAAAMWATCPTQAAAAVWMSCVNISISVALGCACVYLHDRAGERGGIRLGSALAAALLLFLAQCSYETAIAVPGLCVLVDLARKRSVFTRGALIRYASLAAVTLAFLFIRAGTGAIISGKDQNFGFSPDMEGWQVAVSAPWFLWKHLSMWLLPLGRIEFCSTYVWGVSASKLELAGAWVGLLLLLGLIGFLWKRHIWIAFGLLWFLGTIFPSANFIPVWCGPIEDYYVVYPGVGLAIAIVGLMRALAAMLQRKNTGQGIDFKWVGGGLVTVIALWRLSCIPLFWLQAELWNRPVELFLRGSWTRPAQYQLQALASIELLKSGQLDAARLLALEAAKTGPWHPTSGLALGCVALCYQEFPEAEARFSKVMAEVPQDSQHHDFARLKLAATFAAQPAKRPLVREMLLPLLQNRSSPSHLEAIYLNIENYISEGKAADARRATATATKLHPDNPKMKELARVIEEKFPLHASSTLLRK